MIVSRPPTRDYRDGWVRIFGAEKKKRQKQDHYGSWGPPRIAQSGKSSLRDHDHPSW